MAGHDPKRTGPGPGQPAGSPGERVAKRLARAGVASRREVERLIEAGRVALNGQVLTSPAVKVERRRHPDRGRRGGRRGRARAPVPLPQARGPGDHATRTPRAARRCSRPCRRACRALISVGRLDINSEGLLLLTNDGGLARALEMPATGLVRRYRARARGRDRPRRSSTR